MLGQVGVGSQICGFSVTPFTSHGVWVVFSCEEWKTLDFPLIFHYKPSILRDLPHELGNPHWKTLKPMIEMFIVQSTSSCREISLEILLIVLMPSNILCHRNPDLIKLSCHFWLVVWIMAFIFHNIWDNPSHWPIFFRGVETTNQTSFVHVR